MPNEHAPVEKRSNRIAAGAAFAVALVAVFLLLLRWDVALMRWRYTVMPEMPGGPFGQILDGFRNFGQVLSVVIAICIVALQDSRRRTIVLSILLAQAISAFLYDSGKYTISRHRPYDAIERVAPLEQLSSSQTWSGRRIGNREFALQSFPSGHSAAAFALACVLARFYPGLRWLFWILALGCATSRYLEAVHWPSDCFVGAVIGCIAARVAVHFGAPFALTRRSV